MLTHAVQIAHLLKKLSVPLVREPRPAPEPLEFSIWRQVVAATVDIDIENWRALTRALRSTDASPRQLAQLTGCDGADFSRWMNHNNRPADGLRVLYWVRQIRDVMGYDRVVVETKNGAGSVLFMVPPEATVSQFLAAILTSSASGAERGGLQEVGHGIKGLAIAGQLLDGKSTWVQAAGKARRNPDGAVEIAVETAKFKPSGAVQSLPLSTPSLPHHQRSESCECDSLQPVETGGLRRRQRPAECVAVLLV